MRQPNPGDHNRYRGGLQESEHFFARTRTGQIAGLNPRNGTMDVLLLDAGMRIKCLIPLIGLSISGFTSSWIRYMPRIGDFVEIAFGPDNTPKCVGMTAWGNTTDIEGSPGYRQSGYAELAALHERGNVPGIAEFTQLESGEWDLRSAGSAYLKGGANGTLFLAGGLTQTKYVKARNEIITQGGLVSVQSGDTNVEWRLGDVKRKSLSGDAQSVLVGDQLTSAPKEAVLKITETVPTSKPLYEHRLGRVYEDSASPSPTAVTSTQGSALRVRGTAYTDLGTNALRWSVDAAGNVDVTATTGAALDLRFSTVNLHSGGTADQFMVRGNELYTWLVQTLVVWATTHVHGTPFGPTSVAAPVLTAPASTVLSSTAKLR